MRHEISRAAQSDLHAIWNFGLARFGTLQANTYLADLIDLFDLLCTAPEMNRIQTEFGLDVRLQLYGAHIVFYRIKNDVIVVERILSRYQNWTSAVI